MTQSVSVSVGCFGKVPSRGDFVRAGEHPQLMALLDKWVGGSLELLSRNPDWKRLYDQSSELQFAFLGSRSKLAACGQLVPSRDASTRRFPLLVAARLEVPGPVGFIARSPMALTGFWSGTARSIRHLLQAEDAGEALRALAEERHQIAIDPAAYDATFMDFLEQQSIDSLERVLAGGGHVGISLRHMLPALGLLLQPLLSGGGVAIDKALRFPLPREPLYRPLVASFWLDLVSRFVKRGDFELAVLLSGGEAPALCVGFNGADPDILCSMFDLQAGAEHLIAVQDAAWVEDYLPTDYALNKLASYIDRSELSLKSARAIFTETFVGG